MLRWVATPFCVGFILGGVARTVSRPMHYQSPGPMVPLRLSLASLPPKKIRPRVLVRHVHHCQFDRLSASLPELEFHRSVRVPQGVYRCAGCVIINSIPVVAGGSVARQICSPPVGPKCRKINEREGVCECVVSRKSVQPLSRTPVYSPTTV
jgi:hypothetical protein